MGDIKQELIADLRTNDTYKNELSIYYKKASEAPSANKIQEYADIAADRFELTKVVDKAVDVLDKAQTEIDQLTEDNAKLSTENQQLKKDIREYDNTYKLPDIAKKQIISVDRIKNAKRLWARYDKK